MPIHLSFPVAVNHLNTLRLDFASVIKLLVPDSYAKKDVEGYASLPLYTQGDQTANLELVSIYPELETEITSPSPDSSTHLPDGYLYIFVDGFLWRELKVIPGQNVDDLNKNSQLPSQFADINFEDHRGKEQWQRQGYARQPVSYRAENLLIPKVWNGQSTNVQIAFSETQWAWDYLLALGGFHSMDPRFELEPKLPDEERQCPDPQKAEVLRNARLQTLDLSSANAVVCHGMIQHSIELVRKEIHHFNGGFPNQVRLVDGVQLALHQVAKFQVQQNLISLKLHEIQGLDEESGKVADPLIKAEYDLASFMVDTFFYQPDATAKKAQMFDDAGVKPTKAFEQALEHAEDLIDWREEKLDLEAFWERLGYNDLIELANEAAELKKALVEHLKDEDSPGHFSAGFEDYGYHRDFHFNAVQDVFSPIAEVLKLHPAMAFANLIREADDWQRLKDEDEGQDFLLTCVDQHPTKPGNRIARVLFPRSKGDGLNDFVNDEAPQFSPEFYLDKISGIQESESLAPAEVIAVARRFSHFLTAIAASVFQLPDTIFDLTDLGYGSVPEAKGRMQARIDSLKDSVEALEQQQKDVKQKYKITEDKLYDLQDEIDRKARQRNKIPAEEFNTTLAELEKQRQIEDHRLKDFKHHSQKIKTKMAEAQAAVHHYIQHLNTAGDSKLVYLSGAKVNPLFNVLRLVNYLEQGSIKEVKLLAEDYNKGLYDTNLLPLNAKNSLIQHKEQIRELKQFFNKAKKKQVFVNVLGKGSHSIPFEDIEGLTNRLEQYLSLLEDAEQQRTIQNILHQVKYLFVKDKLDGSPKQKALETAHANVAKELDNLKHQLDGIPYHLDKNLELQQSLSNQISHLESRWGFDLDNMQMANKGLMGVMALLEVNNFRGAFDQFLGEKSWYNTSNFFGSLFDLAAVYFSIQNTLIDTKAGPYKTTQLARFNLTLKYYGKETGTIKAQYLDKYRSRVGSVNNLARASVASAVFTLGIAAYDAKRVFVKGDTHAVIGHSLLAVGSAVTLASSEAIPALLIRTGMAAMMRMGMFMRGLSFLGWIGIGMMVAGQIWLLFRDKPIESWLGTCPWGKDANPVFKIRPDLAQTQLMNLMAAPVAYHQSSIIDAQQEVTDSLIHDVSPPLSRHSLQIINPLGKPQGENLSDYFELVIDHKNFQDITEDYKIIDLFDKGGPYADELSHFHNHSMMTIPEDQTGLKLEFSSAALAPLMQAMNTNTLQIRFRTKAHPNQKGASHPLGNEPLSLPIIEVTDQGELKGADQWSEASFEVRLPEH